MFNPSLVYPQIFQRNLNKWIMISLFWPIFHWKLKFKRNIGNKVMLSWYLTVFCQSFVFAGWQTFCIYMYVNKWYLGPKTARNPVHAFFIWKLQISLQDLTKNVLINFSGFILVCSDFHILLPKLYIVIYTCIRFSIYSKLLKLIYLKCKCFSYWKFFFSNA